MMKVIKDKNNLCFYFSLLSIRDDYIPSEKSLNFIRKILFSNILYSAK